MGSISSPSSAVQVRITPQNFRQVLGNKADVLLTPQNMKEMFDKGYLDVQRQFSVQESNEGFLTLSAKLAAALVGPSKSIGAISIDPMFLEMIKDPNAEMGAGYTRVRNETLTVLPSPVEPPPETPPPAPTPPTPAQPLPKPAVGEPKPDEPTAAQEYVDLLPPTATEVREESEYYRVKVNTAANDSNVTWRPGSVRGSEVYSQAIKKYEDEGAPKFWNGEYVLDGTWDGAHQEAALQDRDMALRHQYVMRASANVSSVINGQGPGSEPYAWTQQMITYVNQGRDSSDPNNRPFTMASVKANPQAFKDAVAQKFDFPDFRANQAIQRHSEQFRAIGYVSTANITEGAPHVATLGKAASNRILGTEFTGSNVNNRGVTHFYDTTSQILKGAKLDQPGFSRFAADYPGATSLYDVYQAQTTNTPVPAESMQDYTTLYNRVFNSNLSTEQVAAAQPTLKDMYALRAYEFRPNQAAPGGAFSGNNGRVQAPNLNMDFVLNTRMVLEANNTDGNQELRFDQRSIDAVNDRVTQNFQGIALNLENNQNQALSTLPGMEGLTPQQQTVKRLQIFSETDRESVDTQQWQQGSGVQLKEVGYGFVGSSTTTSTQITNDSLYASIDSNINRLNRPGVAPESVAAMVNGHDGSNGKPAHGGLNGLITDLESRKGQKLADGTEINDAMIAGLRERITSATAVAQTPMAPAGDAEGGVPSTGGISVASRVANVEQNVANLVEAASGDSQLLAPGSSLAVSLQSLKDLKGVPDDTVIRLPGGAEGTGTQTTAGELRQQILTSLPRQEGKPEAVKDDPLVLNGVSTSTHQVLTDLRINPEQVPAGDDGGLFSGTFLQEARTATENPTAQGSSPVEIDQKLTEFNAYLKGALADGKISTQEKDYMQQFVSQSAGALVSTLEAQGVRIPAPGGQAGLSALQASDLQGKFPSAEVEQILNTAKRLSAAQTSVNVRAEGAYAGTLYHSVRDLSQKLDQFDSVGVVQNAFRGEMSTLAKQNPAAFDTLISAAYQLPPPTPANQAIYDAIRTRAASGELAPPPNIAIVDRAALGGANGAYAPNNGGAGPTIMIARDLASNPEQMQAVYAEEMFHHLEQAVPEIRQLAGIQPGAAIDTQGDEGRAGLYAMRQALQTPADMAKITQAAEQVRDQAAHVTGSGFKMVEHSDHGTINTPIDLGNGRSVSGTIEFSTGTDAINPGVSPPGGAVDAASTTTGARPTAAVQAKERETFAALADKYRPRFEELERRLGGGGIDNNQRLGEERRKLEQEMTAELQAQVGNQGGNQIQCQWYDGQMYGKANGQVVLNTGTGIPTGLPLLPGEMVNYSGTGLDVRNINVNPTLPMGEVPQDYQNQNWGQTTVNGNFGANTQERLDGVAQGNPDPNSQTATFEADKGFMDGMMGNMLKGAGDALRTSGLKMMQFADKMQSLVKQLFVEVANRLGDSATLASKTVYGEGGFAGHDTDAAVGRESIGEYDAARSNQTYNYMQGTDRRWANTPNYGAHQQGVQQRSDQYENRLGMLSDAEMKARQESDAAGKKRTPDQLRGVLG